MKWIELGLIDYKLIIPLIYPFLSIIKKQFFKTREKFFFNCFINYCGYLLGGIIYLIIKCRMKNKKNIILINLENIDENKSESPENYSLEEQEENQILIAKNKMKKKLIIKQYLFILLLTFIYLIPMSLNAFVSLNRESYFGIGLSFSLLLYILFYITLSRIILGQKIYEHQIFSTIIILISIIIIIIIIFAEKSYLSKYDFLNYAPKIIITVFFSLFNVLGKKYYNIFIGSPYYFMFILGLFSLILILLYEIITVAIFGYDTKFNGIFYQFYQYFKKYEFLYILMFIGELFATFITLAGIQLTIYFFTPCHFFISESISQVISTIADKFLEDFSHVEKVIIYIFFIIILLAAFIYNEIIIINVFNLSKNTKKKINMRQSLETEEILEKIENFDNEIN